MIIAVKSNKMNEINDIKKFAVKNARYFLAAMAIIVIFFISRSFPAEIITSESCAGGNCQAVLENPSLSKKNPSFYVNDALNSDDGRYFRLTFLAKANKDAELSVKITNSFDEEKSIKTLKIGKSSVDLPQEILFSAEPKYSDILFEKTDVNDGADIIISDVRISKLEINSDAGFDSLRPTIRGSVDTNKIDQKQTDNSYVFNQLKESDIILGQIFKPDAEYISGVALDIDIIKQDNGGGKKYKFELREADYPGEVPEITSRVLSSVDFTAENIERFRQENGMFKFPVFAKVDPQKYYFIGINNNNVTVDKFNFLRLKGTAKSENYADGTIAVKTKGKTYSAVGDLYFITYQLDFNGYKGEKVPGGAVIEDLGKQKGLYIYKPLGGIYDLADLEDYSSDIKYNENKEVLAGTIESGVGSFMLYQFNTFFPITRIKISGRQTDSGWDEIAVSYSFDKTNWKEIPENLMPDPENPEENLQYFDYSSNVFPMKEKVYVKISPKETKNKKSYGVSDFKIEADILMK